MGQLIFVGRMMDKNWWPIQATAILDIRSLTSNKCIAQDAEALLPAVAPPGPSWRLGTSGGCRVAGRTYGWCQNDLLRSGETNWVAGPQKSACFPSGVIFHGTNASAILNQWVNSPRFQSSATEQKPEVLWLVLLFWPISHIHPHATRGYSRYSMSGVLLLSLGYAPRSAEGVIGGSRRPAWRMPSLHPIRPEGCLTMGCVSNPGGHFCWRVSTVSSRVWHDIFFSRSCTLCFDWIMCRSIRFGAPIVWLVVNVYPWDDQTTN